LNWQQQQQHHHHEWQRLLLLQQLQQQVRQLLLRQQMWHPAIILNHMCKVTWHDWRVHSLFLCAAPVPNVPWLMPGVLAGFVFSEATH